MFKKITAAVLAVIVTAAGLTGLSVTGAAEPARALSGAEFDPGNIISDAVFFNGTAMDEGRIQSWLDANIGACENGNCLNVKRIDTTSRGADAMCGAYAGAAGERVSRVLAKVSRACGINPQVLLVTLQKEQSLVSGSIARAPSVARLDRAMGYACPDTANGGCDPSYAGVYNQLYRAAWQFKRYANPAGTSNFFTWFRPGTTAAVHYNPNAACGTKPVAIKNQATANLYYYTPYTPNPAALANLNGTGDACSAYGNRNFWVYFTNWFGSPTGGDSRRYDPVGSLDSAVSRAPGVVSVAGWALDPDSLSALQVHVYVDGRPRKVLTADRSRPDVALHYPRWGAARGFSGEIEVAAGTRSVCAYAINTGPGANSLLGGRCSTVTVAAADPFGSLDRVQGVAGGVQVRGWAGDRDTRDPLSVHVYVDGRLSQRITTDQRRSDVSRVHPDISPVAGFDVVVPASAGQHQVCAYGINVGRGVNTLLGSCVRVTVPSSDPFGSVDSVTPTGPGSATVTGWAIDPDTAAPVSVHVYVDGVPARTALADGRRTDVGRAHPWAGSAHGFSTTLTGLASGSRTVCVYGINVGPGQNSLVGGRCSVVRV